MPPVPLPHDLAGPVTVALARATPVIPEARALPGAVHVRAAAAFTLRLLARRIQELTGEIDAGRVAQSRHRLTQRRVDANQDRLELVDCLAADLVADALASLNIRSISTCSSPDFAIAAARPDSTARAARGGHRAVVLLHPVR